MVVSGGKVGSDTSSQSTLHVEGWGASVFYGIQASLSLLFLRDSHTGISMVASYCAVPENQGDCIHPKGVHF